MDIVQNSIAADAKNIIIEITENSKSDLLQMIVQDDGKGMDPDFLKLIVNPFTTTRTTRKVGLGIPLLKEAAELANGSLEIESKQGKGTILIVRFQRSHIDRMPLGDLASTLLSLVVSYPEIHFLIRYCVDDKEFLYDDEPIKKELAGLSISNPDVLAYMRQLFERGIHALQKNI